MLCVCIYVYCISVDLFAEFLLAQPLWIEDTPQAVCI